MEIEGIIAKRIGKVIYKDGDSCVKLFDADFSKQDILNEAHNQSIVEETGLNMPKLQKVTMINGKWAIVNEFVEGTTLAELMDKYPEKEDEYLELFVNLQLEILSKRAGNLKHIKDKMRRKINEANLGETLTYDLQTRLEGMPTHYKLCHGDFNPSNIIIAKDGTPFVIDWSHATQGNGSADASRTFLLFTLAGKNELADKYINLFCKKTNTEKSYIQKWIPIVAASQLVKGKEDEKDFLLKWASVVDYE